MAINIRRAGGMRCILEMIGNAWGKVKFGGDPWAKLTIALTVEG
jgi:hypothetical protein